MPIFYSKKEKGSKPYPNVKFRTLFLYPKTDALISKGGTL